MVRYCRPFNVFEAFYYKIGDPHVLSRSGVKVVEGFPIISNLAVTTGITISYSRADLKKWSRNILLTNARQILIFLTEVIQNSSVDTFKLTC